MIESPEFDANMSVFSGFNSFHRALAQNQTVQNLRHLIVEVPNANERLLERLVELVEKDSQSTFQHTYDVAIAAYLYAISESSNIGRAIESATNILTVPNLDWARRLAEIVLENQTATLQSEVKIIDDDAELFSGKIFGVGDSIQTIFEINIISSNAVTASIKVEDKDSPVYPIISIKSLTA